MTGPYGPKYAVTLDMGAREVGIRLPEMLTDKLAEINPQVAYTEIRREVALNRAGIFQQGAEGRRLGEYFIGTGDDLYQKMSYGSQKVNDKWGADRIRYMLRIAQAAESVRQMNETGSDDELAAAQAILNEEYTIFCKKYKCVLNRAHNRSVFRDDPRAALIFAMERKVEIDPEELPEGADEDQLADLHQWVKTEFFTERIVRPVSVPTKAEGAQDAVNISMAHTGRIDWELIEKLCGKDPAAVQAELNGTGLFYDPALNTWATASQYLSGNVRVKRDEATAAGLTVNIPALDAVMPPWVEYQDIHVAPNASWLPEGIVSRFMYEALEGTSRLNGGNATDDKITYEMKQYTVLVSRPVWVQALNKWVLQGRQDCRDMLATTKWGTPSYPFLELMMAIMNSNQIAVYITERDGTRKLDEDRSFVAREKAKELREVFAKWVWEDEARRVELERIYNYRFKSTVAPVYDGSLLTFPGMNQKVTLRPHQSAAVARAMTGENLLLWHIVGSGKTISFQTIAMELKRIGLRQKSMLVVPNHLLMQAASEFQWLYPGAKLLIVDSQAMAPDKRAESLARIATERWDSVIISHSTFRNIPIDPETLEIFNRRMVDETERALRALQGNRDAGAKRTVKMLETKRKNITAAHKKRMATALRLQTAGGLFWKDMGIDLLIIDESQDLIANLGYVTNMSYMAGVGGEESGMAYDAYMKTQAMTRVCADGHILPEYATECPCGAARANRGQVVIASGTPVKNSLGQLFVLQKFLQLDALIRANVAMFDQWAAWCAGTIDNIEMAVDGSWKIKTRFARFFNVEDLLDMFAAVNDAQMDRSAMKLEVPNLVGDAPIAIEAQASEWLREYMLECGRRLERSKKNRDRYDNALRIFGHALMAAVDPRLIDPSLPMEPEGKIAKLIAKVTELYNKHPGKVQAVFLDVGTPGGESGFNLYADIKAKLVSNGIAEDEIAFVHDAATPAKKRELFQRVNEAKVRVILGSTKKMGTGTNMQRNLIAVHQVDAPWTPDRIQQRDGRAWRQGNTCPSLYLFYYVTSGSLDMHRWNLLKLKMGFINQLAHNKVGRTVEDIDDNGEATAEQMMAIAAGDKDQIAAIGLEREVKRLGALRVAHYNRTQSIEGKRERTANYIEVLKRRITEYSESMAEIEKGEAVMGEAFYMEIDGQSYENEDDATQALSTVMHEIDQKTITQVAVTYGAVRALVKTDSGDWPAARIEVGAWTDLIGLDRSPRKALHRIMSTRRMVQADLDIARSKLAQEETELVNLNAAEIIDFPREKEYRALVDELTALHRQIDRAKAVARAEAEKAKANEPVTA